MAMEKDPSPTLYLKHKGVFSKKEMMDVIHNWFTDNRYKFHASKYKIKADEAEYEIKGEREVTEYVRYVIELHIWVRDLKEIEVIKDGEKKKMDEGNIQLELGAYLEFDYSKRFKGNKFIQWLHDIYQKYIIRQTIKDVWEDDLLLKQTELLAAIKEVLGVEVS
ncbi:MAG: hypothetical protein QXM31_00405 [Candidatus Woesearchaeota archaeon]